MAETAHKKGSKYMKEHFETKEDLEKKCKILSDLIKNSRHCTLFTGAGISTSCGIPDFRGPEGVWTLRAQKRSRKGPTTSTLKAIPSKTHMAIVELLRSKHVKYVVSQNCDGLHRRSGVKSNQISELHGNTNLEICGNKKCMKEYLRDFRTRRSRNHVHDHETGRMCTACGGKLYDSIINFTETLPKKPLNLAIAHGYESDLCIVLGSSMTVRPACEIPPLAKKLVIVNLQLTQYNKKLV